jgi:hypothetical protein
MDARAAGILDQLPQLPQRYQAAGAAQLHGEKVFAVPRQVFKEIDNNGQVLALGSLVRQADGLARDGEADGVGNNGGADAGQSRLFLIRYEAQPRLGAGDILIDIDDAVGAYEDVP